MSDAGEIPKNDYDLACIFDAWHDMGDPVGIAASIKETLQETVLLWWSSQWH